MVVKVYGARKAACPQRVMLCLVELGVEFELVPVDLQSLENKTKSFLLKQPFGQIPVIEEGDFTLYESRAIIRYYAAKYADKGPNLLGTTLEAKALVDQWLEVEAHNFNDLIYNMVLQLLVFPQMGRGSDLELVKSCEEKLKIVLDVYEERLSKSTYLAGEAFTLADLSHIPALRNLGDELGLGHLITERENLNAWWKDISSRPAWKKIVKLMD
ncbi:glutathione S-transferase F11-like [Impatiens glandulifera]|uniref:glutathione S-transferase F11-like n=1 Tax=Impatiens glandulifera TaxID=253017 RepID=UPI001FB0C940|nr:glutathione S-transferase F11-like [Impatiens glandulifera]